MSDTNQNRRDGEQPHPGGGVFDKKNLKAPVELGAKSNSGYAKTQETAAIQEKQKEDFKDPFAEQAAEIKSRAENAKPSTDTYAEKTAAQINKSFNNKDSDLDDIEITEDDLKLAEKMIFDGYAETEVTIPNFPDKKFVICSTNAEEIGLIDEAIFEIIKKFETDDGMVDLPQNKVQTLRNSMFLALGYKGINGYDLCDNDRSRHLSVIKKAIIRRGDFETQGEKDKADNISKALKEALLIRARRIQQMPTPLIDFLSNEKYMFDKKMFKIMTTKGVVPKS